MSAPFRFKQFAIEQLQSAMKVGTDGVLLGAWARVEAQDSEILDIGCGTGLVALMLAQRTATAHITGVEIDERSATEAAQNVQNSPWAERVDIAVSAIQEYRALRQADLVVCNPPYFTGSLTSPDMARTVARHALSLPLAELASAVERLLAPKGRFAVVLPVEESRRLDALLGQMHLAVRCAVRTTPRAEVKRYLSEYVFGSFGEPCERSELVIEGEHSGSYSDEYTALTRDFYLKM